MKKRITMTDIANQLNISTVTVSKALGNKEGVSENLRKKIIELAEEMGYDYNPAPKNDENKGNRNIGILVHEKFMDTTGNSFYWKVYHSIIRILKQYNSFGILEILDETYEKQMKVPKIITESKVDGVIILGQIKDAYIDVVYNIGIPAVLLDFYNQNAAYDSIISDSFYGSYMATNHLIVNGHQKIAFLGDIHATSSILDRYLGYCKALIEHNICLDDNYVIGDRDEDGKYIDFELPKELPSAFVCNCDEAAYLLVNKLKSLGIKIPEDISVVGFDNYIISALMDPPLTTVEVNIEGMAEAAVDAIFAKVADKHMELGRKIISSNIIYRNSVKKLNK